ncbi:MAG: glycosyltransferase family 61 protein [Pseudomonadales bacterium]|jgi:capsular polysaccharide biosynthesis protein|nr:glycosyltransferase family 61 protein [Pseudomonadales bacterium]MDP6470806.1 glycosyltransferase family 61 protein [Pseudomonadales bacterium]|tara:strand:- start:703 stop:2208 length:1506 start_codon:yes stop_codon:yes gene_type:complete
MLPDLSFHSIADALRQSALAMAMGETHDDTVRLLRLTYGIARKKQNFELTFTQARALVAILSITFLRRPGLAMHLLVRLQEAITRYSNKTTIHKLYAELLVHAHRHACAHGCNRLQFHFMQQILGDHRYTRAGFAYLEELQLVGSHTSPPLLTKPDLVLGNTFQQLDMPPLPLLGAVHPVFAKLGQPTVIEPPTAYTLKDCWLYRRDRLIAGLTGNREVLSAASNDQAQLLRIDDEIPESALARAPSVDEPVFWPGDKFSVNAIAHFYLDWLGRMLIWRQYYRGETHLVVDTCSKSYIAHHLTAIAANRPVIRYPVTQLVHFRKLTLLNTSVQHLHHPLHGRHPEIVALYESFRDQFTQLPHSKTPEKVYLTRSNEHGRKLVGEPKLLRYLEAGGFHIEDPGLLTPAEQIHLFRGARVIIAPHGGALANLLFCHPDTRVLELFPPQGGSAAYFQVCTAFGFEYSYATAQDSVSLETMPVAANEQNIEFNIARLIATIEDWL